MHRPLLLRGARQLLTFRGAAGPRRGAVCLDLGIIPDGSILIRDGRIVSIGPSRRVDNLAEARHAVIHETHGAVVMPGFLDAAVTAPENAGNLRRLLKLAMAHGATTVGGTVSIGGLRDWGECEDLRLGLVAFLDVESRFDESRVIRAVRRGQAQYLRADLHSHSVEELRFLRAQGLPIRACHSDPVENLDWVGLALAYGASVVEVGAEMGRSQRQLLCDSTATAVLPMSRASLAREWLDGGAALALGTGFAESGAATCSMQTATLTAVRVGGIDLAEALTLGTINAAYALGVAGTLGSLELGKQADMIVLQVSDYRDIPDFFGGNIVSNVFRAGTLVS